MSKTQSGSPTILEVQPLPKEYPSILEELKRKIKESQTRALVSVNLELISVYWEIGKTIHEQQQTASWGSFVVTQLAKDLQKSFPGSRGYSRRNLYIMRDLYTSYHDKPKVQALSAQISWTHNVIILEQCKNFLEREFYMKMSKRNGWTYRVLEQQIENKTYEKTLTSQTNFEAILPEKIGIEAKLAVKDEYAFPFLDMGGEYSERELERALVSNIEDFLREVGNVYTFVGSQYRLEVGGQEYLIDLVLYHRKLRALVAIDIKIGRFIPEHVGKMQFYLAVLNEKVRLPDENPSIGIILCKEKNRTIVEYALKETNKPINVASYKTVVELPHELQGELPSIEQISKLLEFMD